MQYVLTGMELEYRECQVLREAVRLAESEEEKLFQEKDVFAGYLMKKAGAPGMAESKKECLKRLAKVIHWMDDAHYELLVAYLKELKEPDSQIQIMQPFDIKTGLYLLPVNTHRTFSTPEDETP